MNKASVVIGLILTLAGIAFLVYHISNYQADMKVLNENVDIAKKEKELADKRVIEAEQAYKDVRHNEGASDQQIQAEIDRIKGK